MPNSSMEKSLILYFRFVMAWTFLYAASHQVFVPTFSVVGFLSYTKTWHDVFVVFTTPTMAPITTFLVEYGHLADRSVTAHRLDGARVSAAFGVLLMIIYWFAHMDWPFIENTNNFIVDYHLVYAGVLVYLIVKRAGHVFGLDAWAENLRVRQRRIQRSSRWLPEARCQKTAKARHPRRVFVVCVWPIALI